MQKRVWAHFKLPGHISLYMVVIPFEKLGILAKTKLESERKGLDWEKKEIFLKRLNRW